MKKIAFLFGLGLGVVSGIIVGVLTELNNEAVSKRAAEQNYVQRLIYEAQRAARERREEMEQKLAQETHHPF